MLEKDQDASRIALQKKLDGIALEQILMFVSQFVGMAWILEMKNVIRALLKSVVLIAKQFYLIILALEGLVSLHLFANQWLKVDPMN